MTISGHESVGADRGIVWCLCARGVCVPGSFGFQGLAPAGYEQSPFQGSKTAPSLSPGGAAVGSQRARAPGTQTTPLTNTKHPEQSRASLPQVFLVELNTRFNQ